MSMIPGTRYLVEVVPIGHIDADAFATGLLSQAHNLKPYCFQSQGLMPYLLSRLQRGPLS